MPDVERLGTLHIEHILSQTDRLVPYVAANDKTPVTDGFIQVYEGHGRSADDIVGRLDIQVKGLTKASGARPRSFQMPRKQLEAIRRHGTVLLFVVFVRRDGSYLGRAQYKILSPYAVDAILEGGARGSVAIGLDELPESTVDVEAVIDFALDTQKQKLYLGSGAEILDKTRAIWVRALGSIDLQRPQVLSASDGTYIIEAELNGGERLPLNGVLEITPASYVERAVDLTVSCRGITYETPTIRQIEPGVHLLTLSEGITLTLRSDGAGILDGFEFNLALADNLAVRRKDVEFALALRTESSLLLNGGLVEFEATTAEPLDELRAVLVKLEVIASVVACLGARESVIDMTEVSDEQLERLSYLHASLVEDIPLTAEDGRTARVEEYIGRWKIPLMVLPAASAGTWKYVDPFAPSNRDQFKLYSTDESEAVVEVEATVYETVQESEMPRVLNLHLEDLPGAYSLLDDAGRRSYFGTQTVLKLLHAADGGDPRGEDLLLAARALNRRLEEEDPGSIANVLNRLQITRRIEGDLSADEAVELRALRRRVVQEQQDGWVTQEAGCAILLGSAGDLSDCLDRMSEKERQDLAAYPIWALAPRE